MIHSRKNIDRHTAHTIVSWPNPKQWVIVHTSELVMIIRQSIVVLVLDTGQWIGIETCSLNNVFSLDDLGFGSDTEHEFSGYM